jgi:hypothetical protein
MNTKRNLLLLVAFIVLVAGGYLIVNKVRNSSPAYSTETAGGTTSLTEADGSAKPIKVVGTVACLDASATQSGQSTSCAVGLQDADGKNYALNAQDPTMTGNLPTGQKVEVSGTVSQPKDNYQIDGIITVNELQRL